MENTKKVAANAATAFIANGDLRLSDHFKLREFTLSGAAIRYNLDNTPTTVEVERLRALCVNVLEPLRHRFGVIRITSGYRSERVNKIVGGAVSSQQRMCEELLILDSVAKSGARWIHVSLNCSRKRREFFTLKR